MRRRLLVGGALALIIVVFTIWKFLSPNPLATYARKMAWAMVDGDGQGMFDMATSQELECSNLSPDILHKVWELILEPVILSSKRTGETPAEVVSNQTQADAAVNFQNRHGEPWKVLAIVNQTDTTPKGTILYSLLATGSVFDSHQKLIDFTGRSALFGLRRYRSGLESLGIKKVLLNPSRCVSWDQLDQIYQYGIDHTK